MKFEMPTFRRAFLTGLLVLAPLGVTAWVFYWLFRTIDDFARPLLLQIPAIARNLPEEGITGIGVVASIIVVVLVGFFANNLLGRTFFGNLDRLINRIPWIKGVYGASKEIAGVVFSDKGRAFRRVVLFEYPRRGTYSIGFVTLEPAEDAELQNDYYHVFLPTSPNPTSGYFLLVPRDDLVPLPMTVEEGLKLIVSGGSVVSGAGRDSIDEALTRLRRV